MAANDQLTMAKRQKRSLNLKDNPHKVGDFLDEQVFVGQRRGLR